MTEEEHPHGSGDGAPIGLLLAVIVGAVIVMVARRGQTTTRCAGRRHEVTTSATTTTATTTTAKPSATATKGTGCAKVIKKLEPRQRLAQLLWVGVDATWADSAKNVAREQGAGGIFLGGNDDTCSPTTGSTACATPRRCRSR